MENCSFLNCQYSILNLSAVDYIRIIISQSASNNKESFATGRSSIAVTVFLSKNSTLREVQHSRRYPPSLLGHLSGRFDSTVILLAILLLVSKEILTHMSICLSARKILSIFLSKHHQPDWFLGHVSLLNGSDTTQITAMRLATNVLNLVVPFVMYRSTDILSVQQTTSSTWISICRCKQLVQSHGYGAVVSSILGIDACYNGGTRVFSTKN